ncbi:MAG: outer membrane beta-barrel protein [Opitutae bacterium]|nr:outer membrane beta-barrel protein [Opitutae bacterium]
MLTALTWNLTRKIALTAQLARDFSTTATAVSVDTTSAALRTSYAFTRRFKFDGGIGYGRNRFLGSTQSSRSDDFYSLDAGASFFWNEHLQVNGSYNYLRNRSTLAFSNFQRHGYSIDISSRF